MNFDIAIIGFGVIGTESLHKITSGLNKKKKIKIAIIEKDTNHIPGGVAYSKTKSKYGFFNNPLRLSNGEFKIWIKQKKNIEKIINFINNNKHYNLKSWLSNNIDFKKKKILSEIYLPRLIYSFFLEEKIKTTIENISKKKILFKFFKGELINIKKKNNYICNPKFSFEEHKLSIKKNNLNFKKVQNNLNYISSDMIILGNGILPPKKIEEEKIFLNNNYIWDFYTEGGTSNLIKKINNFKKKKIINLVFIGNKAGLLETLPELENLISKKKQKFKILSIAPNLLSLEKAENSSKFKSYKFRYLINTNISKIKSSDQILKLLVKEFNYAKKKGFNKYDVWTWILKKNIISKCYKKLSTNEKNKYNEKIFPLIRNLTRYTFPSTVYSKERLEEKKILKFLKDKVVRIRKQKDNIIVYTKNDFKFVSDIVINVSGPINLENISNEAPFVSSLISLSNNLNYRGFIADKNFEIEKNIFAPGTITSNFNPNRLTIIKAVTLNSHKVAEKILKNIN